MFMFDVSRLGTKLSHYYTTVGNDSIVQDFIAEIDVCKYDPWDLKGLSIIKSDDPEWFFFCPRDYKYAKSKRLNRATKHGFWKATGKDRNIKKSGTNNIIGSKKTLVFYQGPLPGVKTNWVIHEYHALIFDETQRTFVLCRLMEKPKKNAVGRTDTLTCDEGILDVVDSLPESTFEAPPQPLGSYTNSPFLGAYFNYEKNNMRTQLKTIQEENESVFRDQNITFQSPFETTPQEEEFVNSFFVDFDFGIIHEEKEHAFVNGPTQTELMTMLYNEKTDLNAEVASALYDSILDASTVPHEHPSTWEFHPSKVSKSSHGAMHGSTSLLSSNKDKMESISEYDVLGMGTSSCGSTTDKPLKINCNEILSSPSQNHPRPLRATRRRSQRPRRVSKHIGWPKNL